MAAPDGAGSATLGTAELLADAERPGGWVLLVDRIRQSYVDLDDPTYLDFEYSQVCADVLAALPAPPPAALAVTHVGGGACTLARFIAATRPGSSQIVLEPDTAVTALVRARLPLPRNARIRIRPVGGRAGIGELRDASADVVVLDAFLGGRVPGELTTLEFLTDVARVLRPDGVLLANIADGPPLTYTARVAATMRAALAGRDNSVVAIADPAVLKRRRFGNVVLAASRASLPLPALRAAAARAPFPRSVTSTLGRGVAPLRDADAQRSPAPPEDSWRVELDWPDDVDA
ncbi:spermidine synthase [uncultured Jatrophihabitans sp.]|uniref:spermidine synthase n=1 Tax=uncultured Jatrophihabitans sp. TaxID=1610747 RepID=UPI0035CC9BC0